MDVWIWLLSVISRLQLSQLPELPVPCKDGSMLTSQLAGLPWQSLHAFWVRSSSLQQSQAYCMAAVRVSF